MVVREAASKLNANGGRQHISTMWPFSAWTSIQTSWAIPVLARSIGSARRGSRGSHANLEGVAKALKDSKRGDHWLNSWTAIVAIGLTLFFRLVQSVEGAVQVYKAYHPEADSA